MEKKPRAPKRDTYVDGRLGTTHVRSLDVKLSGDLPLALGLLDLGGAGEIDLPAVVVDELALALAGHLVVGPGELGGAVTVVLLERAGGLLALGAAAWSAGCTIGPDVLHLLLEGEVLKEQKRQLKTTHIYHGEREIRKFVGLTMVFLGLAAKESFQSTGLSDLSGSSWLWLRRPSVTRGKNIEMSNMSGVLRILTVGTAQKGGIE